MAARVGHAASLPLPPARRSPGLLVAFDATGLAAGGAAAAEGAQRVSAALLRGAVLRAAGGGGAETGASATPSKASGPCSANWGWTLVGGGGGAGGRAAVGAWLCAGNGRRERASERHPPFRNAARGAPRRIDSSRRDGAGRPAPPLAAPQLAC